MTEEGVEEGSVPSPRVEVREPLVHGPPACGPAGAQPALQESYGDFSDMIEVSTALLDELGLKRAPHWTTLQKFSRRADTRRLERLLLVILQEVRLRVLYLAIDSTGFSSTSASTYYTRVLESRGGRLGGHRKGVETRRYLKQTVAAETRKQLIVSVKFRRGPSNDSLDFPWCWKRYVQPDSR